MLCSCHFQKLALAVPVILPDRIQVEYTVHHVYFTLYAPHEQG